MSIFICPVCKRPLTRAEKEYFCQENHRFDVAKERYVNLLPANAKKSAEPGDNKQMVNARKTFLGKGYFSKLADALADNIVGECVFDAGCGTGYYGNYIKTAFIAQNKRVFMFGADISKFAVRHASKAGYDECAVASLYNLPIGDSVFDTAFSVFAPLAVDEFARVIKIGGKLLTVTPAERHLIELKTLLYGEDTYENTPDITQKTLYLKNGEKAFTSLCTERLTFDSQISSNEDLLSLMGMTPYFYKTDQTKKMLLHGVNALRCTFDFYVSSYVKE